MTTLPQWIDWPGGECPVPPTTHVIVKLQDDIIMDGPAGDFTWTLDVYGDNITAYRIP